MRSKIGCRSFEGRCTPSSERAEVIHVQRRRERHVRVLVVRTGAGRDVEPAAAQSVQERRVVEPQVRLAASRRRRSGRRSGSRRPAGDPDARARDRSGRSARATPPPPSASVPTVTSVVIDEDDRDRVQDARQVAQRLARADHRDDADSGEREPRQRERDVVHAHAGDVTSVEDASRRGRRRRRAAPSTTAPRRPCAATRNDRPADELGPEDAASVMSRGPRASETEVTSRLWATRKRTGKAANSSGWTGLDVTRAPGTTLYPCSHSV